jgi:hypothetical protein
MMSVPPYLGIVLQIDTKQCARLHDSRGLQSPDREAYINPTLPLRLLCRAGIGHASERRLGR